MALLTGPFCQFFDTAGAPLAFAKVYFTDTETTDVAEVYQTYELDDVVDNEHPNPVVCDVNGRMPAVFYDQNNPLRMRVIASDGDLNSPLIDIDPVTQNLSVGSAQLQDGAIEAKLGYVPMSPTGDVFEGPTRMTFTPATLNVDDIGFRGTPVFIVNAAATLELKHSGGLIYKSGTTAYNLTLPLNDDVAWPIGHHFELYNGDANNITLLRDTGVTLYEKDDATFTSADITVTPGERFKVTKIEENVWLAS